MPRSFNHIWDPSFALSCCYLLLLSSLLWKKDADAWRISRRSCTLPEITQCVLWGWGYYMRMEIFPFPCLHWQSASDSSENGKVQLFSEGNLKLLYWRHSLFQPGLEVTRRLMKCSTSLKCLRLLLYEGYSGHTVSSTCQETFADFAQQVSV